MIDTEKPLILQKKKPHEMTRSEFRNHLIRTEGYQSVPRDVKEQQAQEAIHRDYVESALRAGEDVPLKVLVDIGLTRGR